MKIIVFIETFQIEDLIETWLKICYTWLFK